MLTKLVMRSVIVVVGVVLMTVGARSASAITLHIGPAFGSTENTGASARINLNFQQMGSNVQINAMMTNATDGSRGLGATAATLVGVAFDYANQPAWVHTYDSAGTAFTKTYAGVNVPGLANGFDFGVRSAGPGNFVGGNPSAGLRAGQSAMVSFLVDATNPLLAGDVKNVYRDGYQHGKLRIAGRFQQVNAGGGSDKVLGGTRRRRMSPIPEPVTAMLGVMGLMAIGVSTGRRR